MLSRLYTLRPLPACSKREESLLGPSCAADLPPSLSHCFTDSLIFFLAIMSDLIDIPVESKGLPKKCKRGTPKRLTKAPIPYPLW